VRTNFDENRQAVLGKQEATCRCYVKIPFSSQFVLIEHDEVFVNQLEHGVCHARASIEERTSGEHHVCELDQRPTGQAVKESLPMLPLSF
jgi:hypothetical protein